MGGVDRDDDIDDELAKAQKHLRQLKTDISDQSKKNFLLEKDVRYLDSRIALLIQNKMGLEEQNDMASRLDEVGEMDGESAFPDRKKADLYGNLFFLLQSEPKIIANLCRKVSMGEIDSLLQTVMFTIYGNQYEQREEHLLLSMFQTVLAAQFEQATEFSNLLRANTPVSRMMTTYTRRGPGQTYIRSCLSGVLNKIIELHDLDLEIHPRKICDEFGINTEEEGVTPEEAYERPEIQKVVQPRLAKLETIATEVLSTIMKSLPTIPYGIRWICKQIRLLTRRKYPSATDTAVCSLIGAFFFLRFVNPAIVTPSTYMLVDTHPNETTRRTLTLIAKMLQNLANKPTYAKEPYMEYLSPFVTKNQKTINAFLNEMCEVPDFYESLEMDQYVALSKKDLSLSITLNEIFGMHQLLEKYREGVVGSDDSHLAIILRDLGKAPTQVPRNQNGSMELALFNLWETQVGDVHSDLDLLRADMIFMEAKTLMINIIRAFPTGTAVLERPFDLYKIADFAGNSGESGLVKRGIKALDLLQEIAESTSDDYELLVREVGYELNQLGSLQESVEKEARSLEDVFKIIREHNEYLRSQLDTYRSYLSNVRQHTGSKSDRPGAINNRFRTKPRLVVKKYTFAQLFRDGVLMDVRIPPSRQGNLFISIVSPTPGTFVVSLLMKGRPSPIMCVDFKVDDLLEMRERSVEVIELVVVDMSVKSLKELLDRDFSKKR